MAKWYKWVTNPLGAAIQDITGSKSVLSKFNNPIDALVQLQTNNEVEGLGQAIGEATSNMGSTVRDVVDKISKNKHVQSLIENVTGERDTAENARNRAFQHDEAEIARNWEEEQAKIAREWDSIGAQMERAAAAGVNPISIAMQNGGINSSATTSIPSNPGVPAGSASLMHGGVLDIASAVFGGIGTVAENRLKQTQADDIVAMRKYNIAEKIANTDHLRALCQNVGLSNVAQDIQNKWLDVMSQATYDGMLLENGVRRSTILKDRSVAQLNFRQIASIQQEMEISLKRFNATLPLELQLMEADIDFRKMSTKEVYEEVCLRHLQAIEQEDRNRIASAEADTSEIARNIAKETYEDAISAFHNDMVRGAAEAGVRLNDYMYYGSRPGSIANIPGSTLILRDQKRRDKRGWYRQYPQDSNIRGLNSSGLAE